MLQNPAKFSQVFDDDLRSHFAQLLQRIIAGQHGTGMNAAMVRRFDVVLHVADEERFLRRELVFSKNIMNFFPFIQDIGIGPAQKNVKARDPALNQEMILMNRAENKGANAPDPAEFKEIARVREFANGVLNFPIMAVEPVFQLRQRHMRRMAIVEIRERQGKFRAKFLQRHFRAPGLNENNVGRFPDRGQIVHKGA